MIVKIVQTDGRRFYYNTKFVDAIPNGETMFVWTGSNPVYDPKVPRDKQLANIAPDYCVNGDLIPNNGGTNYYS